ncbi:hypothetical protein AYO44_02175 [Planctomycetaceae bacterium SCGC AG-212-F19]|nr:hypothetical protein AYO44_02175 [Planctomycetaceae bacterium SCGC AG-212-F19]
MVTRLFSAVALCCTLFALVSANAAPPNATKVGTLTLQPGVATTLVIDGTDLIPNPRILLPIAIASQTVKDGATPTKIQVEIKLADNVPPGVYQMRVASDKGISGPIGIEVDELPQQPFGPSIAKLPAAIQGAMPGSGTLATTFEGKKGQRLVIEVEARRIGSAIDPVIKLYDPRRVQIAWARPSTPLAGDARLTHVLPADGSYTIELHDMQYKAAAPNRFRLRVGEFPHADLPFPLAGQRGTKASFQIIGSVPESTRVEADLTTAPGSSFVRLPRVPGLAGASPAVLVSDLPEVLETDQSQGKGQEVTIPAGINGRIAKPKEEDRYRIAVQPGAKLRFDVLAERAGSPLDGVLILRNEAGLQLARSDDQANTLDPGMEYTVPANVTALVAAVSDVHGRGGPDYVYRLAITPADMPDFSLAVLDDRPHVPLDGAALVRVRATRANYNGPIKLTLPGLLEGVKVTGDEIPAGAADTLLSFTAPEGAKLTAGVLQVIGESTEPNVTLRRVAQLPETPLSKLHTMMRGELAVAVAEPGPVGVAWDALEDKLAIGGKIAAKVTVRRPADAKSMLRLTLVTNQSVPKAKDGKEDVNKAIRLEAAPTLKPGEEPPELKILVPADLPLMPYDLAIRAELLAADNKTVQASAVTPARRLVAAK